MFAFLKANHDLREVFEAFSNIQLDAEDDSDSTLIHHSSSDRTPDFSFLKKEPVVDIHEKAQEWMVDFVEGTISVEDNTSLGKYLAENPSKREELAAFENTVLRADENETIGDLSSLKKETAITSENFEHYAIALIEGTISPNEKSLLESFVLTHPEFSIQLDSFRDSVQKADESIVFDAKSSLKRSSVVVTKDNIEELLFDKTEGQLASHEEAAVDAFLAANPEYKNDLGLLAKTKLVPDTTETFDAKDKLKRGVTLINESNFEQYLISASEGLLNREELKAFNSFVVTHPKYRNALALYAATKLQPDMSVVYDDKEGLKRKEKGAIIWFSVGFRYAAAAVLVILLSVYFWTKFDASNQGDVEMADKTKQNFQNNDVIPLDNNTQPGTNPNALASNTDENTSKFPEWNTNNANKDDVNGSRKVVDPNPEENILVATFTPITILVSSIPNGANESVAFSGALYDVVFNDNNKTQPVAEVPADDYITPGQLAMRWMKDKIDGTDPMLVSGQDDVVNTWSAPGSKPDPKDKNVDGMDITESAVNRVGQSAAHGNIAMEQRKDGTYLQLWNYEVRVGK